MGKKTKNQKKSKKSKYIAKQNAINSKFNAAVETVINKHNPNNEVATIQLVDSTFDLSMEDLKKGLARSTFKEKKQLLSDYLDDEMVDNQYKLLFEYLVAYVTRKQLTLRFGHNDNITDMNRMLMGEMLLYLDENLKNNISKFQVCHDAARVVFENGCIVEFLFTQLAKSPLGIAELVKTNYAKSL